MVIKTDTCFFTELKIFPGHGKRLVLKDGKLLAFINRKSRSLFLQRKRAQRLHWTQAWRRLHRKKGTVEQLAKKKIKKAGRVFKPISGFSMDLVIKKRDMKPDARKAEREAQLRDIKERQRKGKEEKKRLAKSSAEFKKAAAKGSAAPGFTKTPKSRKVLSKHMGKR